METSDGMKMSQFKYLKLIFDALGNGLHYYKVYMICGRIMFNQCLVIITLACLC